MTQKGTDFVQAKYTGKSTQLFYCFRYGDNSLQLVNKNTKKVVSVIGGKAKKHANVGAARLTTGEDQRWITAVSAK